MRWVYLIRHGQAGTRDRYDELSALGRAQSRLLGEYLAAQRLEFDAVYAGGLCRQRQTAEEAAAASLRAGARWPEIIAAPGWSEFDLDRVYHELAPALSAEDAGFRRQYEDMRTRVRASAGDAEAEVHRRWSPCDIQVVEAWVRGRHPYSGESWEEFHRRVSGCRAGIEGAAGNVAVFTSATPIAIWAGLALGIADERLLSLAGVLYNGSITVLRWSGGVPRLFSFNGVPHLLESSLRTHR